jgi:hypothetical protein
MDWGALIGPAVVAAGVSGVISIMSMVVATRTSRQFHTEKLAFDRELAERKINADIALAEKKLALDRALADWKRRTELAEQVLADFYKAQDIFASARTYFAFAGEGATRPRRAGESEDDARHHDAIFAPYERLSKEREFFSEMHARRFRFMALFGNQAATPFMTFIQTYNQIGVATRALIDDRRHLRDEQRDRFEKLIGWTIEDDDPVKQQIDEAVATMETICRPVLEDSPKKY